VPIKRLLQDRAFSPEDVDLLTSAFEAALRELNLTKRTDPAVELVARRIIELAGRGERDPARLREAAVKGVGPAPAALPWRFAASRTRGPL
jgi:hypothetical protein